MKRMGKHYNELTDSAVAKNNGNNPQRTNVEGTVVD
jgi:hypothetical protein